MLPVVAVGHSIGGWAALCLAGARPCARDGAELAADTVTPPSSTELLHAPLGPVTVTVHEGVGRVDVAMTELPPGERPAAGLDHRAFLDGPAASVAGFLATP